MASLYEEAEGKTRKNEEGQERSFDSAEEAESVGEDEELLEGEGRSRPPSSPPLFTEKERERSHRRRRTRRRVRGTGRVPETETHLSSRTCGPGGRHA